MANIINRKVIVLTNGSQNSEKNPNAKPPPNDIYRAHHSKSSWKSVSTFLFPQEMMLSFSVTSDRGVSAR